jgi:hypothetical protein
MKNTLDFYWPTINPLFHIKAIYDGISAKNGHNGYKVIVWDVVSYDGQELLSRFTLELDGNLLPDTKRDLNPQLCQQHQLGTLVVNQARE